MSTENIERGNLNIFKLLILGFIVVTVANLVVFAIASTIFYKITIISSILYDIATMLLIIGMLLLSKNRNQTRTALSTSLLFLVSMGLFLVAGIFASLYPHQISAANGLSNLELDVGHHIIGMGVPAVFSGLFMALAAYFFNEWFNDSLQPKKQFRTFTYFGILFFVAQIITFLGYEMLQGSITMSLWQTAGNNTSAIGTSNLIILAGSVLLLISFIIEIIGGYQIFRKVSNVSTA